MSLGKTLKELRLSKKLNQSDLAKLLNIDRTTYGKYETGDSSPDYDKLLKLADFFGVSTDYLLGHNNDLRSKEPVLIVKEESIEDLPIAFFRSSNMADINVGKLKEIINSAVKEALREREKEKEREKEEKNK